MEKQLYDVRGRQMNIFRLARFYKEGFVHAFFYRVLVLVAPLYGILILTSLIFAYPAWIIPIFTLVVWVLFTPQIFETAKGAAMIRSGGADFNRFNEEYRFTIKVNYGKKQGYGVLLPFIVLAVWILGFVVFLWYNFI